jgi:hypothetical protein
LPGLTAARGKHLLTGPHGHAPELPAARHTSRTGSVSPYAAAGPARDPHHSRIGAGRSPVMSPLPGATATAICRPGPPAHAPQGRVPSYEQQAGRAIPAGAGGGVPLLPVAAVYGVPAVELAPEGVDGMSALRRSISAGGECGCREPHIAPP